MSATVGQPTGASKLCLSCHDGTVALGNIRGNPREVGFNSGVRFMPAGPSRLGTDLRDDHPISFRYDEELRSRNRELAAPSSLTGAVKLDVSGQVQCTSCHNAHDNRFGKFLVASTQASELCLNCHELLGWNDSYHATSDATWRGGGPNPWRDSEFDNIRENACANCHDSHGAGSDSWLLKESSDSDTCFLCHNGTVANSDLKSEFNKTSAHRVDLYTGIHAPNEDASLPMEKHVACGDCHDPHQVTDLKANAPDASGLLRGVSGIGSNGGIVQNVASEYEVCYKCHGQYPITDPPVTRQILENDKRLQFALDSPSFHPIEGMGVNPLVPSLLPGYTEQSIIYCTDCHANDTGPGAAGSGPAGPHGSRYQYLLEREYNLIDGITRSDFAPYALCYKCHNSDSILNNESFPEHARHIRDEGTACSTCHDPHGISATRGNPTNNSNLINFDMTTVVPDSDGRLEFVDQGDFMGECYLTCHGVEHSPKNY